MQAKTSSTRVKLTCILFAIVTDPPFLVSGTIHHSIKLSETVKYKDKSGDPYIKDVSSKG